MRFSTLATAAVLSTVGATPLNSYPREELAVRTSSSAKTDALAAQGARNLSKYLKANGDPSATCTKDNVAVRREW